MQKEIEKIKRKVLPVFRRYGVLKAGLFGSFARGEQKKNSDIDILIDFKGSLLTLVRLERELEKILGNKVDLLTYNGINPLLKRYILKDEVRIL